MLFLLWLSTLALRRTGLLSLELSTLALRLEGPLLFSLLQLSMLALRLTVFSFAELSLSSTLALLVELFFFGLLSSLVLVRDVEECLLFLGDGDASFFILLLNLLLEEDRDLALELARC